ncbi:hypothetical protein AB9F46_22590 [Rhizobium leguminosarum]|uniref:hypothetical protein n=1 Tax=Rhizobium leguminosarum TaxID=384 RepID=UPI000DDEE2C6
MRPQQISLAIISSFWSLAVGCVILPTAEWQCVVGLLFVGAIIGAGMAVDEPEHSTLPQWLTDLSASFITIAAVIVLASYSAAYAATH